MPNRRREGWTSSTYTAPRVLIDAAKAKAAEDETSVSLVIREALAAYVVAAGDASAPGSG